MTHSVLVVNDDDFLKEAIVLHGLEARLKYPIGDNL